LLSELAMTTSRPEAGDRTAVARCAWVRALILKAMDFDSVDFANRV
jgi:hypothetical protein